MKTEIKHKRNVFKNILGNKIVVQAELATLQIMKSFANTLYHKDLFL